jgi:hypothetical protein
MYSKQLCRANAIKNICYSESQGTEIMVRVNTPSGTRQTFNGPGTTKPAASEEGNAVKPNHLSHFW